jgi:hypothetical protein
MSFLRCGLKRKLENIIGKIHRLEQNCANYSRAQRRYEGRSTYNLVAVSAQLSRLGLELVLQSNVDA